MTETVLTHCDWIRVYPAPGDSPPAGGTVTINVGGSPGDGEVEVATNPPGTLPATSVPTGSVAGPWPAAGLLSLDLHYKAKDGAPQTVSVSVSVAVTGA